MPDATTLPIITFDGQNYEVKYRARDLVAMKKNHQVDMLSKVGIHGADVLDRASVLISYGIAHVRMISPEEVVDLLYTCSPNILETYNTCQEALGKVVAQLLPALSVPTALSMPKKPTPGLQ